MWGWSGLAFKVGLEVGAAPKRHLYEQYSQQDGIMGGTCVTF